MGSASPVPQRTTPSRQLAALPGSLLVRIAYCQCPLSITAEHAEAIQDFPELVRHDPFDRLLVAQASRTGLRLLTADQTLLGLGRDFIIDAGR